MDTPNENQTVAWQPLTPRGLAAFARASLGRLLFVQLLVAIFAAGTVVWFLHRAWFPLVATAIRSLPAQGQLRAGRLEWPESSPSVLGQSRFLAFTVDLQHEGVVRSPSHLLVEFGRNDFKVFSLLGYVQGGYPRDWTIPFNRAELEPWWGAWSPMFLALSGLAVATGLMLAWAFLAALYSVPVWLSAFLANRNLTLRGAWRLAAAALLPGALLMTAAILVYGLGGLDLVLFALAAAMHFVLGWVYLVASFFFLPRHPGAPQTSSNPFSKG